MIEWLSDFYIRLILNFRILLDNPTQSETVAWLRLFSLVLLAVVLLRFSFDRIASRRLRRRSRHWVDRRLLGLVTPAAEALGLKKRPELFLAPNRWPLAFSHGMLKPAIFLAPTLVARLSNKELEAVVTHEMAHFRRRDSLRYWLREALWVIVPLLVVQTLAVRFIFSDGYSRLAWWGSVILVLAFRLLFNPLDRLRERSCDDQTIAVTGDPLSLASALLRINRLGNRLAREGRLRPVSIHAFVRRRSSLARRVRRLVDYRRPRIHRIAVGLSKAMLAGTAAGLVAFSITFHSGEENQLLVRSVWAAPCPSVLLVE